MQVRCCGFTSVNVVVEMDMSSCLCVKLQANAFLRSPLRADALWCLQLHHFDCRDAYDANNTFELAFSSLEVEASLCDLLVSMGGWEDGVAALVLQIIQYEFRKRLQRRYRRMLSVVMVAIEVRGITTQFVAFGEAKLDEHA
jgi:hypothetical protein